jgi:uncharacterized DUF497 family protein
VRKQVQWYEEGVFMRHSSRFLAAKNRIIRESEAGRREAERRMVEMWGSGEPIQSMADVVAGDPFSHLYYELDTENGGVGNVVVEDFFEWNRAKSNLNVKEKGFSFYLARLVYKDKDKVVLGKGTTEGSKLIAGVIPGDTEMMVVVQIGYDFPKKRVRIISAFYSDNQKYLSDYYVHQSINREIYRRNVEYLASMMKKI